MRGFGEVVRPAVENWEYSLDYEFERAEEGLLKIMEWNRS